jgi:hypothetical protein
MSLRKNERCPIHNSFFCCRWKQLWRQREVASPVRDGINQIRACRFWRGIPDPTSQETRVPPPDSTSASLAEVPHGTERWDRSSGLRGTHAVEKVQMQVRPRTKSVQSTEKSFGAVMPAHSVLVSPLLTVPQPEPFVDADTAAAFVRINRRTLLQKVGQARFLDIPWIVVRKKRMAIQTLRARPLSLLCDKLRSAAT